MEWLTLYEMIALLEYRSEVAVREELQGTLTCTVLPPSLEQGCSCSTLVGIY
jgi:hypothetical protein